MPHPENVVVKTHSAKCNESLCKEYLDYPVNPIGLFQTFKFGCVWAPQDLVLDFRISTSYQTH